MTKKPTRAADVVRNRRIWDDLPKVMLEDLIGQEITLLDYRIINSGEHVNPSTGLPQFMVIKAEDGIGGEFRIETAASAIWGMCIDARAADQFPVIGSVIKRESERHPGLYYYLIV